MPDAPFFLQPDAYLALLKLMARGRAIAPCSALIVFEFDGDRVRPAVYSHVPARELIPVLQTVVERMESGLLQIPVSRDALRWIDADGP